MLLFKLLSTKKGSNLGLEITWCIGMKHLNVKNALYLLPQKPLACISALALSLQLVKDGVIDSPVSGIKGGSIATSLHTSCSHPAVRSRNSLWRIKVKPPCQQIIALSALKEVPQTQ